MSTIMYTVTGQEIDVLNPDPDKIDITDIVTPLSRISRFGGHIRGTYTVLDHSLYVHYLLESFGASQELILAGLLHDAHEAYLGDVITPVKNMLGPDWHDVVNRWNMAIAEYFNIDVTLFDTPSIHVADQFALWAEMAIYKFGRGPALLSPWPFPNRLPEEFIDRVLYLQGEGMPGWIDTAAQEWVEERVIDTGIGLMMWDEAPHGME